MVLAGCPGPHTGVGRVCWSPRGGQEERQGCCKIYNVISVFS